MRAIITGSGADQPPAPYRPAVVQTPYGDAFLHLAGGTDPVLVSRHGPEHRVPPHLVNYRANIWALRSLGVDCVLATFTVGSIAEDIAPGDLVVVDQLLDMTSGRAHTFVDGAAKVEHVDATDPMCRGLIARLLATAWGAGLRPRRSATYVCTNGPRLETAAEIRAYSRLGADVVGMTAFPEAALAREAGIHYAGMAVSVNWAAGIRGAVVIDLEAQALARARLLPLFVETLRLDGPLDCRCPAGLRALGTAVRARMPEEVR